MGATSEEIARAKLRIENTRLRKLVRMLQAYWPLRYYEEGCGEGYHRRCDMDRLLDGELAAWEEEENNVDKSKV